MLMAGGACEVSLITLRRFAGSRQTMRPRTTPVWKVNEMVENSSGALRYEFFTPYHRGFDLVWDFLCEQPDGSITDGVLTIKGSYGYERVRDLRLFADEQQIGHGTELWERFSALEPVFRSFWRTFEQSATDWKKEKLAAEAREEAELKRRDDELCARVLAAAQRTLP